MNNCTCTKTPRHVKQMDANSLFFYLTVQQVTGTTADMLKDKDPFSRTHTLLTQAVHATLLLASLLYSITIFIIVCFETSLCMRILNWSGKFDKGANWKAPVCGSQDCPPISSHLILNHHNSYAKNKEKKRSRGGHSTPYSLKRVGVKPGLWTMDWTMDWTLDWTLDWIMDCAMKTIVAMITDRPL